ncbi:hypothetical protein [Pelosinus sp. sgz500959]|uniref:hypothetical protein n=1 Tax=Pelosinus sp. sgz500959 TaxID=3242472 RepID=UPI0036719B3A
MWWKIIKSITDHMVNDYDLSSIPALTVKAGIEGGIPDYPAIRVCRGGERNTNILTKGRGTVIVLIDCWEGSDDQDPGVAYELINNLEEKMIKSLIDWFEIAPTQLKVKLSLEDDTDTDADGEMFRPTVGSTTRLKIKWNK